MTDNARRCPCCGTTVPFPTEPGEWEYNTNVTFPEDIRPKWIRAQIRTVDDPEGYNLRFHPYGWTDDDDEWQNTASPEPQWWPDRAAWRKYQP